MNNHFLGAALVSLLLVTTAHADEPSVAFATSPIAEDFTGAAPASFKIDDALYVRAFFGEPGSAVFERKFPGVKCGAPRDRTWQIRAAGGEWITFDNIQLSQKRFDAETTVAIMDERGEKPVSLYTGKPSAPKTLQYIYLNQVLATLPEGDQVLEVQVGMNCFGTDNKVFALAAGQFTIKVDAKQRDKMAKATLDLPKNAAKAGDVKLMRASAAAQAPDGFTVESVTAAAWTTNYRREGREQVQTHRFAEGMIFMRSATDKNFCAWTRATFKQNALNKKAFETEMHTTTPRDEPRRILCSVMPR